MVRYQSSGFEPQAASLARPLWPCAEQFGNLGVQFRNKKAALCDLRQASGNVSVVR